MAHRLTKIEAAGLDRMARVAGEAFAHEEVSAKDIDSDAGSLRWLWWVAAGAAGLGLVLLHYR